MTRAEQEKALQEALAGKPFVLSLEASEKELDDRSRRYVGMGIAEFDRSVQQGTVAPSSSAAYMMVLAEPNRS